MNRFDNIVIEDLYGREKKNKIYSRFLLHSNEGIYQKYIDTKVHTILQLLKVSHGDYVIYYKLLISDYVNSNYSWMRSIYMQKYKNEMSESIKKRFMKN